MSQHEIPTMPCTGPLHAIRCCGINSAAIELLFKPAVGQLHATRNEGRTTMRYATIIFCAINLLGGVQAQSTSHQFAARITRQTTPFMNRNSRQIPPTQKRIVIAASMLLDGKGHVLKNTRIVIEDSRIVRIDPKAGPIDYDLRRLTVLPGWIDAHVHITWSFGHDGKSAGASETSQEAAYSAAANAWVTLLAGFTTVQSVGSPTDVPLRDAIAKGLLPGPRILTAIEPLVGQVEKTGPADEIRAFVRKQKTAGADLIKIFASQSIRQGGGMTLSQEQLNAACDEAKKQGLRTLVHAYKNAVRAATLAGCTEIEHGTMATDDDLKLMAEKGTYLDPQAGLIIENYLLHKEQYLGTPGYTAEGFAAMEKILPMNQRTGATRRENSEAENCFRDGCGGGRARAKRGGVH